MTLLFLIIQLFLVYCLINFVSRIVSFRSLSGISLQTLIFYLTQITGTTIILGLLGQLNINLLLIVNGLIAIIFYIIAGRLPKKEISITWQTIKAPFGNGVMPYINGLLLFANGIIITLVVIRGYLLAPGSYDGLCYHLPMVQMMIQKQHISLAPVFNIIIDTYPKNVEIWYHWIFAFFRGDFWVDIAQLPFLFLAQLSVYTICKRLGSKSSTSFSGALLFPFAPVVIAQLNTTYTDVALSALLLATIAQLVQTYFDCSKVCMFSFAASLGILLGTKFTGLMFSGIFTGCFILIRLVQRTQIKKIAGQLVIILFSLMLLGSYTYLCNLGKYNNPFYPYHMSLGFVEFEGPRSTDTLYGIKQTENVPAYMRVINSWIATDVVNYSSVYGGFGFTWPFMIVTLMISFAIAIKRQNYDRLLLYLLIGVLFIFVPLHFRSRFTIFILGLGAIGLAHAIDLNRNSRTIIGMIALVLAYYTIFQCIHLYDFLINPKEMETQSQPCWNPGFDEYIPAYQFIRKTVPEGIDLIYFRHPKREICACCFWNADTSNQVVNEKPKTEEAFIDLVKRNPRAYWFIPKGSMVYKYYMATSGLFEILFQDNAAIVLKKAQYPEINYDWTPESTANLFLPQEVKW